jgi:hypothetical protein
MRAEKEIGAQKTVNPRYTASLVVLVECAARQDGSKEKGVCCPYSSHLKMYPGLPLASISGFAPPACLQST